MGAVILSQLRLIKSWSSLLWAFTFLLLLSGRPPHNPLIAISLTPPWTILHIPEGIILLPLPETRSRSFVSLIDCLVLKYLSQLIEFKHPVHLDPRVSESCRVHKCTEKRFSFKHVFRDEHLPAVRMLWHFQKHGCLINVLMLPAFVFHVKNSFNQIAIIWKGPYFSLCTL